MDLQADDALFTAVREQNMELAEKFLVENRGKMSKDAKYIDSIGLVHLASRLGHAAMVDLLLIYGFDYCGTQSNQPIEMICEDACLSEQDRQQIRRLLDFAIKREPCEFRIRFCGFLKLCISIRLGLTLFGSCLSY